MSFKAHYEGAGSKEDIPINEFTERIPPEIALELYVFPCDPKCLKWTNVDPSLFPNPNSCLHFPRCHFHACRSRLLAADYLEGKAPHCVLIAFSNETC